MTWKRQVLVVANVTAGSQALLRALQERARREPTRVHLVVPATPFGGGRSAAHKSLSDALAQLREAGLEADGAVGNSDPLMATLDAWDPMRYDEIIVSTLPIGISKWLHAGLPERIARLTGAPVTHVVSRPGEHAPHATPAPVERDHSLMGPLSVLGWGSPHREGPGPRQPDVGAGHSSAS